MMCDKLFTINVLLNAKQIPIIRGKEEAFNRLHVPMLVHISQFQTRLSLHPPPAHLSVSNTVHKGILKVEQGGFRKMHGTVDSIFILKILIDKYMKSKLTEAPKFTLFILRRFSKSLRLYTSTETIRQTEKGRCPRTFPRRFNIRVLK